MAVPQDKCLSLLGKPHTAKFSLCQSPAMLKPHNASLCYSGRISLPHPHTYHISI